MEENYSMAKSVHHPKTILILLFLVFSLIIAPSASASNESRLDININLGLLSGAGVSYDKGVWEFGLDLETTFPVWCIGSGMVAVKYEEPFWQAFRWSLTDFIGADAYTYVKLLGGKAGRVYAGLDVMFGTEPQIRSFEVVLRPTLKLVLDVSEKTSVFAAGGFSLLELMYAPGFARPLFGIPKANWITILTGCRLGVAIDLK